MPYGTIKVDTITFTSGSSDVSVAISGLVQNPTFSGDVTVTGTVSGTVVRGNTVSGATVTGTAGQFGTLTGNTAGFTTVTGTTVTGTTANFVTVSGNTLHTITGIFASGSAASPSITFSGDLDTGLFTGAGNTVGIAANGAAVLTVSGTSVGVGTSSPSSSLHISASVTNASGVGSEILRIANTRVNTGTSGAGLLFVTNEISGANQYSRAQITGEYDGASDVNGRLLFATANTSGTLVERMRIDASGRLGIGITAPTAPVHIKADDGIKLENVSLSRIWGIIPYTGGGSPNANFRIYDFTASADRLNIDTSGRVGIGTTSPSRLLHLSAADSTAYSTSDFDQTYNFLRIVNTTGTKAAGIYFGSGSTGEAAISAVETSAGSTSLTFGTRGSGSRAERMRLDEIGRLLVGTTSPISTGVNNNGSTNTDNEQCLQVASGSWNRASASFTTYQGNAAGVFAQIGFNRSKSDTLGTVGNALASNDVLGGLTFSGSDGGKFVPGAWITATADGTFSNNDAPGRLGFFTTPDGSATPLERLRITNAGSVLIGKTIDNGTTDGTVFRSNGFVGSALSASTNSSTSYDLYSSGAGLYRFYVGLGGTIYATSTTISAASDVRLKENIRDLDVGLDAILALKPRKFDWKEGKGKNIKDDRGFIAQEFEEIFPDLIDEWKDPAPEGEEPYKSVRQDLIPVLVKAMQEQQAMIAELQAEVAALKAA